PLYERIELLWRLELLRGTAVDASIWRDLATQGEKLLADYADWQTTWMHHWLGVAFARAGEWARAAPQGERLRRLPAGPPGGDWSARGARVDTGRRWALRSSRARWRSSKAISKRRRGSWSRRSTICTRWAAAAASRRTSFATRSWKSIGVLATSSA